MPKVVDVKIVGLSGDLTGSLAGTGLAITGSIFGVTFEGAPEDRRDIFSFPDGPLTIRNGETAKLNALVGFTLRNPTFDPPGLSGLSLRFGGRLINAATGELFGESFKTINTFTHTQIGMEHQHVVRFISGNDALRADFVLAVASSF
jgi:hypothetical protein